MHQGPSLAGGHQHFGGARLPVHPGILARHVDIETMVGVLDDGNAKALLEKMRDNTRQQRGLAGAAPSRQANHFHPIPPAMELGPSSVIARSEATKQSTSCRMSWIASVSLAMTDISFIL